MISPLILSALTALGGTDAPVPTTTDIANAVTVSEEAANVFRTYNIESLYSVFRASSDPQGGLVPISRWQDHANEESYTEYVFAQDTVMHILYERLGEELEYEGRGMNDLGDGKIVVLAPEAVHAEVVRTLAFLDTVASSHTELTIDVLTTRSKGLGSPNLAGLVPLADAEAWLAQGVPGSDRSRHTIDIFPARVAELRIGEERPVVSDWDLEIAQGSAILDPITRILPADRRLNVCGSRTENGLLLGIQLAQGAHVIPPTTRPNRQRALVGSEGHHELIDMPANTQFTTMWNRSIACNSMLADDQALILRFDLAGSEGEGFHEAIVIRRTGGDMADLHQLAAEDGRALTIIDTTVMFPPHVEVKYEQDARWESLTALSWRDEETWRPRGVIRQGEVDYAIAALDEAGGYDSLDNIGPWLMCTPEESDDPNFVAPDIAEIVRANSTSHAAANISIELRRGGSEGEVLRRTTVGLCDGGSNILALGVERSYEFGYDVEVAQHAASADPETVISFDGLFCTLALSQRPGGGLRLQLEGQATALVASNRFDYAGAFVERAHQPTFETLKLDNSMLMESGETTRRYVLGNQLSGSGSRGLTLVVTVDRK